MAVGMHVGKRRWAVTVVTLLAVAVLLYLPFVVNDYIVFIGNLALVFILAAFGFNIIIGYLGQLAFANAALMGIGAYTVAILSSKAGLDVWLAMVLAPPITALCGAVVGLPSLRLRGYYLAIITIVFSELVRWGYVQGSELTGGSSGLRVPELVLFGTAIDQDREKFFIFLPIVAALLLISRNLLRSRIGRAIVAMHQNEQVAMSAGIRPWTTTVIAFAWSGFIVGAAGAMFAVLLSRVTPESFGVHQLLLHFVMVMVGGLGSLLGSVLGAVLLAGAPEVLRILPGLEEVTFAVLLIAVFLIQPGGLAAMCHRFLPRLREKLRIEDRSERLRR